MIVDNSKYKYSVYSILWHTNEKQSPDGIDKITHHHILSNQPYKGY